MPAAERLLQQMDIAVALRPRSGFVRAMKANAFALNGRFEDAVRCMDVATEIEPRNAVVWFLRALPRSRPDGEGGRGVREGPRSIRTSREEEAPRRAQAKAKKE
jgi:predicted Zn-dependent protease